MVVLASTFISEDGRDLHLDRFCPRGQIGIPSDKQVPGFACLATRLHQHGAIGVVELSHSGAGRFQDALQGGSDAPLQRLVVQFVAAARRAVAAGMDGVEIMCTHGDALCQLLQPQLNRRTDGWGGELSNRMRGIQTVLERVRAAVPASFLVGVRLSPIPYKRDTTTEEECLWMVRVLEATRSVDYVDLSMQGHTFQGNTVERFSEALKGTNTRLMVCGGVGTTLQAQQLHNQGADLVAVARVSLGNPDFARNVLAHSMRMDNAFDAFAAEGSYVPKPMPHSWAHLTACDISVPFLRWLSHSRQHCWMIEGAVQHNSRAPQPMRRPDTNGLFGPVLSATLDTAHHQISTTRYNQQVPDDVVWALDTHNDRAQDSCNTEAIPSKALYSIGIARNRYMDTSGTRAACAHLGQARPYKQQNAPRVRMSAWEALQVDVQE